MLKRYTRYKYIGEYPHYYKGYNFNYNIIIFVLKRSMVIKGIKTDGIIHFEIYDKTKDVILAFCDVADNYVPINLFKVPKEKREVLDIYE